MNFISDGLVDRFQDVNQHLIQTQQSDHPWLLLHVSVENIEAFKIATDVFHMGQVLIFLAKTIEEIMNEHGTDNDFFSLVSDNDFIIITTPNRSHLLCKEISKRVKKSIDAFYPFQLRQAGKIAYKTEKEIVVEADLLKLFIGVASHTDGPFFDVIQLFETATNNRHYYFGNNFS